METIEFNGISQLVQRAMSLGVDVGRRRWYLWVLTKPSSAQASEEKGQQPRKQTRISVQLLRQGLNLDVPELAGCPRWLQRTSCRRTGQSHARVTDSSRFLVMRLRVRRLELEQEIETRWPPLVVRAIFSSLSLEEIYPGAEFSRLQASSL